MNEAVPDPVETVHPDDFVLDIVDLAPVLVAQGMEGQAPSLGNPARTVVEVLDTPRSVSA